ncbi:hypothetical protein SLEP1_g49375 [Rubroshorea leprosula]|uniref:Uncharacterized protein n=1 Tax=Rubroshorea leprosula TaxID=152421 RepID=A0AAV5LWN9_9ROSI|nr:hypothetical protein SLEP1_g49375 [Rubroshorea leprosula]
MLINLIFFIAVAREILFIVTIEHQYETVSGFLCKGFGYVPKASESIKVVLERDNQDDDDDDKHDEDGSNHQEVKASNIQT